MTDLQQSVSPRVRIDGVVDEELTLELVELRIEEQRHGLKTLEISFLAAGEGGDPEAGQPPAPRFLDGQHLDFGKRIEVVVGPAGGLESRPEEGPTTAFDGKISAIEVSFAESAPPRVCVFAEDRFMELRLTRRVQAWGQLSDADIARAIAERHGLDADADAPGPSWESVKQLNMSDLAFLRERARLIGAELWIEADTLHFKARGAARHTDINLARGGNLLEVTARADLAHQRSGVRVRGWDASLAEAIDVLADGELVKDEPDAREGLTGPELLERNFGRRTSLRVREVPPDREAAEDLAKAELLRRARGFVKVSGVSSGTPHMTVGSRLSLDHVGAPFEGEGYTVTEICHSYDRNLGFRTRFDAERSTIRQGSSA